MMQTVISWNYPIFSAATLIKKPNRYWSALLMRRPTRTLIDILKSTLTSLPAWVMPSPKVLSGMQRLARLMGQNGVAPSISWDSNEKSSLLDVHPLNFRRIEYGSRLRCSRFAQSMGVGKTRPLFSTAGRECSDNYDSNQAYLHRSGWDRRNRTKRNGPSPDCSRSEQKSIQTSGGHALPRAKSP